MVYVHSGMEGKIEMKLQDLRTFCLALIINTLSNVQNDELEN